MSNKKNSKEIDNALNSFNKLYEKGGIVNLGKYPRIVEKVKTKRPSFDYLTDGGIPKGRMILIAGEPSAGKSSWSIQMADLIGEKILYIDTEATLTTDYLIDLGVDPYKFSHAIPESTEQACNIIRREIANYDVVIFDSINNSASEEQLAKEAGDKTMANRAIVFSSQIPIMIGLANQHDTTLMFLSQVRDNMNKKNPYSPDKVIPGGNSLHHNSSMTVELSRSTKKKAKDKNEMELYDTVTGRMITFKVTKNKVGSADRTIQIEFTYGKGFIEEADIASTAIRLGVIEKAGSWLKYKGESICQGQDNLLPLLLDNPNFFEELKQAVNKSLLQILLNEESH
jgi:recombination protein RecA